MQTLGDQLVQFRSSQETLKSPKFKLLFKWVFEKILAKSAAVLIIDRFFSEGNTERTINHNTARLQVKRSMIYNSDKGKFATT